MTLDAKVLIDGTARGEVLKLDAPICFWGGIDPITGRIADPNHPDFDRIVTEKILAIPWIVGSSSSSQLLLELMYKTNQPAAIILGETDTILGVASLVGREMAFGMVPILQMPLESLANGQILTIEQGGHVDLEDSP